MYTPKHKPLAHQQAEFDAYRSTLSRAIFWDQGTGKSKALIDLAWDLYQRGEIDGVLIVAPTGVRRNWAFEQIPEHTPEELTKHSFVICFETQRAATKRCRAAFAGLIQHKGLSWLTISYDALLSKNGKEAANEFLTKRKCLYVLDESQAIKNVSAARTKAILKSARFAPYRRVMTGTPSSQGPFDMYPQIHFLDDTFWFRHGFGGYHAYRSYFAHFKKQWNPNIVRSTCREHGCYKKGCIEHIQRGGEFDMLVGYRNLDRLQEIVSTISSRVLKEDVLDLPPKVYQKRTFPLSPEQARVYASMRDEFIAFVTEHDSTEASFAILAITRLLRLCQISSGFLPVSKGNGEDPNVLIPGAHPRIEELLEVIREASGPVIVWARFTKSVDLIMEALRAESIRAVRYDGAVNERDRYMAKSLFQGVRPIFDGEKCVGQEDVPRSERPMVFVANPSVDGGTGLTLTAASTVVYYENSFRLLDRLQSEDRAHRIGQQKSVLYIDLIAEDTKDEQIVDALRKKFDITSIITDGKLREWI